MGTYADYRCARATSTGAYSFFYGNPDNYTQVKTATFYNSSVAASNVYAWLATTCVATTLYAYICETPITRYNCPTMMPPPAPNAPVPATLCAPPNNQTFWCTGATCYSYVTSTQMAATTYNNSVARRAAAAG
jgi:hypothetical protein